MDGDKEEVGWVRWTAANITSGCRVSPRTDHGLPFCPKTRVSDAAVLATRILIEVLMSLGPCYGRPAQPQPFVVWIAGRATVYTEDGGGELPATTSPDRADWH